MSFLLLLKSNKNEWFKEYLLFKGTWFPRFLKTWHNWNWLKNSVNFSRKNSQESKSIRSRDLNEDISNVDGLI